MKNVYAVMALNGFCEPVRVLSAPLFVSLDKAERYIIDNGLDAWVEEWKQDDQNWISFGTKKGATK